MKATVFNDDLGETPTLRTAVNNIAVKVDQSVNFDEGLNTGLKRVRVDGDGEAALAGFILKNKAITLAVEGRIR